ncbi:kinesin-like protein KIN-14A, partial [Camellia sinensis]|uniref:kinesin-like protein KIN-14A n=1 Tax=Camellia sinensis TaxID=4442 RepID=UPI001036C4C1
FIFLIIPGNIKVFCRTRPIFEDEGPSVVEFPDDCTIRIPTGVDDVANPKKDFEFDRVYGPHVGQAELFSDVQPFVQSALDGYNVSVFAYGQTESGKTHTMVGSSHDRGLYARSFEELFDLSNSDTTSISRFNFSVTVFEIYNEQIRDLLSESRNILPKIRMGSLDSFIELAQEKVDNPLDFSKVLKVAFQNRGTDLLKFNFSHLYVLYSVPHIICLWLCCSIHSDLFFCQFYYCHPSCVIDVWEIWVRLIPSRR